MKTTGTMGFWERIGKVYTKPAQAMEDIKQQPKILFPLLLVLLSQPIYYLLCYPAYLRFTGQLTGETDPQALSQLAMSGLVMRGVSLVIACLVSSLLMFGYTKMVGGKGTVKQFFATNGYASLAILPMLVIMGIASIFTGELLINFSPAIFVPHLRGTVFYGILRSFCAFFVWQHVLMGIGFYRISGTSKAKSFLIVAVIFLIEMIINLPSLQIL